jgi:hypothetical protein
MNSKRYSMIVSRIHQGFRLISKLSIRTHMTKIPTSFNHLREFKVVLTFFPVGSAPKMKVSKFTVPATTLIGELSNYVTKILRLEDNENKVHIYFHSSIELLDDQYVGDFAKIFGKASQTDSTYSMNVYYSIGSAYL